MLIPWSQRDLRWSDLTIGRTNMKMKDYGCLITAISSMDGRSPDIVLDLLNENHCFTKDGLLIWGDAARTLGMQFDGMVGSEEKIKRLCIAETRRWINWRWLQHFFVWLGDGNILDPWDGKEKLNLYRIYSYRLFYPKEV